MSKTYVIQCSAGRTKTECPYIKRGAIDCCASCTGAVFIVRERHFEEENTESVEQEEEKEQTEVNN